jgi:membrane peptidoglycan carboxypeptidase
VTLPAAPPRRPHAVAAAIAARRSRSARIRRRRRQLILWFLAAVLVGTGTFGAGLLAAPLDYSFQPMPPQAVLLLDSSGRVFATIRAPQDEEPVTSAQIPMVMKDAIVAAEDERFFAHRGVDPLAAVRALWRDISGAQLQGGSTITQQYVKNVYTGSQRTALRKLREASLAIRLEQHLSKDEILTRYLNTLYLGNGTAGVQAASKFYFGVPIDALDLDPRTGAHDPSLALARAATLAGIAPAPSIWNPVHSRADARRRELYVLNRMIANHMITPTQASAAYGDALPPIVQRREADAPTVAPEFRDLVADHLARTFHDDNTLYDTGGVRVTTTLNLNLQKAAVQALHQVLPKSSDPEAAIVAVDPRNGDIRALTEKKDGGYKPGGFDLATGASRSSGSTIKPFTLALALMRGHSLDEVRPAPYCTSVPYHLCNAESGSGYQTLRSALVASINTVYGPLAVELGLQRVVNLATAAGMDVSGLVRDSRGRLYPSQALGIQVSPLSEAVAYGTLVDHGVHHEARTVLTVQSKLDGELYSAPADPFGTRVIPRRVADEVTGVMQSVVDDGTGTAARQPFPVYGKTGTTDDFTNAWFTGCTHTLCITVWMGYDKQYLNGGRTPHSMRDVEGVSEVFGGTLPAQIFAKTWDNLRALQQPRTSPSPSPVVAPPVVTSPSRTPHVVRTPRKVSPTPRSPSPAGPSPSPSPTRPLLPPPTAAPEPAPSRT